MERGLQQGGAQTYWTAHITDPGSGRCGTGDDTADYLMSGFGCLDVRIQCQTGGRTYPSGNRYWTTEISEESETRSLLCRDRYFMTGVSCSGHWCDNLAIECSIDESRNSGDDRVSARDYAWSEWMSEEGTGSITFPEGTYARGMKCRGHYCDDKRFLVCFPIHILDREKACDYDQQGLKVASPEAGPVECDYPDALLVGFRCIGRCNDVVKLHCDSCDCVYPENDSYWTDCFADDTPAEICEDDYFMAGMEIIEDGDASIKCTWNAGRTAGEGCIWSAYLVGDLKAEDVNAYDEYLKWYSPRGMECSGGDCERKRFWLCPVIKEENACAPRTEAPTVSPSPTLAPTSAPTRAPITRAPATADIEPFITTPDDELFSYQDMGPDNRIGRYCFFYVADYNEDYTRVLNKAEPSPTTGDDGWPRRIDDDTSTGFVRYGGQRHCLYFPSYWDVTEAEKDAMCHSEQPGLLGIIEKAAHQMRHAIRKGACDIE